MRIEGYALCPKCNTQSLPRIAPESHATGVRCQNSKCRNIVSREDADLAAMESKAREKEPAVGAKS
jgi:hypothetical protein